MTARSSEFRRALALRLREVESKFPNRATAARAAGVSKTAFAKWVGAQAAPAFESLARLSAATGYSLEWIAYGAEPKMRGPTSEGLGQARAGGYVDGELYEEVFGFINRFSAPRRIALSLGRLNRLADEISKRVDRYEDPERRGAAIEVLVELRVPQEWDGMSAHEKMAAAGRRHSADAPEAPPKPD